MARFTGVVLLLSAALFTTSGCSSSTGSTPQLDPAGLWTLVSVDAQPLPGLVSTSTDPATFMNSLWYSKGCASPDSLQSFAASASLNLKTDSTLTWTRTYIDRCMRNDTVLAVDTATYNDSRMLWSRPEQNQIRINLADWYSVGTLTENALDLVLYTSPNHYRYERP